MFFQQLQYQPQNRCKVANYNEEAVLKLISLFFIWLVKVAAVLKSLQGNFLLERKTAALRIGSFFFFFFGKSEVFRKR